LVSREREKMLVCMSSAAMAKGDTWARVRVQGPADDSRPYTARVHSFSATKLDVAVVAAGGEDLEVAEAATATPQDAAAAAAAAAAASAAAPVPPAGPAENRLSVSFSVSFAVTGPFKFRLDGLYGTKKKDSRVAESLGKSLGEKRTLIRTHFSPLSGSAVPALEYVTREEVFRLALPPSSAAYSTDPYLFSNAMSMRDAESRSVSLGAARLEARGFWNDSLEAPMARTGLKTPKHTDLAAELPEEITDHAPSSDVYLQLTGYLRMNSTPGRIEMTPRNVRDGLATLLKAHLIERELSENLLEVDLDAAEKVVSLKCIGSVGSTLAIRVDLDKVTKTYLGIPDRTPYLEFPLGAETAMNFDTEAAAAAVAAEKALAEKRAAEAAAAEAAAEVLRAKEEKAAAAAAAASAAAHSTSSATDDPFEHLYPIALSAQAYGSGGSSVSSAGDTIIALVPGKACDVRSIPMAFKMGTYDLVLRVLDKSFVPVTASAPLSIHLTFVFELVAPAGHGV
jgi:hypothetical protein